MRLERLDEIKARLPLTLRRQTLTQLPVLTTCAAVIVLLVIGVGGHVAGAVRGRDQLGGGAHAGSWRAIRAAAYRHR